MEVWNLYKKNKDGKLILTDLEQIRGERIPDGFYHLVVHVWIKNSNGMYLISKRSEDRKRYPLLYECVGVFNSYQKSIQKYIKLYKSIHYF